MCHVHVSLSTGHVSCPLSSQYWARAMSTFLSVQGTYHVHFPFIIGHVSCPLSLHYRACIMSTFLSLQGTCHVHFPPSTGHSNDSTACHDSVWVAKLFPACQRVAVPLYSMAEPLKKAAVTKHSITSRNTHILSDSPVRTSNLSDVDFLYFITLISPHAMSLPSHCHSVMLLS
jgi:hypothetical protein